MSLVVIELCDNVDLFRYVEHVNHITPGTSNKSFDN